MDWVNAHVVLEHNWLDPLGVVVVDWVLHVLRHVLLKPFLVNGVVVKYFYHHYHVFGLVRRIEPNLEDFVFFLIQGITDVVVAILIVEDVVEHFLQDGEAAPKDDIRELGAPEDSSLHVLQLDIFKSKDLLGVVVRNSGPLHLADFHLHDVF